MLHEKYIELLANVGITINQQKPTLKVTGCCDISFYEMQIYQGYYVCHKCSKVFQNDFCYTFNEYSHPNEPVGARSFHNYTKKRKYKHLNHFIEVLKRYTGVGKIAIPDEVYDLVSKNIDLKDKDAYIKIRKLLKDNNQQKYYHEIFPIIYKLGGQLELLDNENYWKCINLFKMFTYKYLKMEEYKVYGKKSIPSYYMLLDSFLKRIGHTSYYNFPELGNVTLRSSVQELIEQLEIKQSYELFEEISNGDGLLSDC